MIGTKITNHNNNHHSHKRIKPPTLLVGVDVGGTKVEALVVNQKLKVLGEVTCPTETTNANQLVHSISHTIQAALTQAQASTKQVAALGLGIPGQVNPDSGYVRLAVNLNLKGFPLGQALSSRLGIPVTLENDGRIAAIGAYHYFKQQEPLTHLAFMNIGTGISAGLILDGKLHRGRSGMAGEIGHVIVEPDGPLCHCGLQGCLEAVAAGPAIARQGAEFLPQPVTAATVYEAAQQGHPQAKALVKQMGRRFSRAIQWLIMAYDVDKIVLGGGVTRLGHAFLNPILAEMAQLRAHSPLAQAMLPDHKVVLLPPGYNAGTWGAIALAQQRVGAVVYQHE